jgi:CheY-like chemotaxis protein
MLVDDGEIDLYLTEKVLSKYNFAKEVIVFRSAKPALEYLRSLQKQEQFPNYIFLDIRMPDMSGFDFLDEYIQIPEEMRGQCNVVMLSTSELDEDVAFVKKYPVVRKYFRKHLTGAQLSELNEK